MRSSPARVFSVAILWERLPASLVSGSRYPKSSPDEMTAGDIGFVGGQGLIRLDRGVRDYLVRALRER
jgi:hypothetical protein